MRKPNILLTNDDGIQSPGLAAAASALQSTGELRVVAPLHQQTAMGRAHTGAPDATLLPQRFFAGGKQLQAFACDASPASAVGHGLLILQEPLPDLVVSGINYGENLGTNITSSGTIGAALEAASRGIPSIAISLGTPLESHRNYSTMDWSVAEHFLSYFSNIVLRNGLPKDVHVLKIDVPGNATTSTPWRLTKQSMQRYYESSISSPSLSSRRCDAIIRKQYGPSNSPGTDVHAFKIENVVSVTPLSLDLTSRTDFSIIHTWLSDDAQSLPHGDGPA